jgi:hypothetical protein
MKSSIRLVNTGYFVIFIIYIITIREKSFRTLATLGSSNAKTLITSLELH